jgi:hypothetical protein
LVVVVEQNPFGSFGAGSQFDFPRFTRVSGQAVARTVRPLFAINLEKIARARRERIRSLNSQSSGANICELENDKHRSADDVLAF